MIQQKKLIFCILAVPLCGLPALEAVSSGQEIVVNEATFDQLETLIGEVVAGRKKLSKDDRVSFVKRISTGEFNKEKWFDINACNVIALAMLDGQAVSTEAETYFTELEAFFKTRPDLDDEYEEAVRDILLMFKVLTLGNDRKGRLAEKKWFQSIDEANQKGKVKMIELLSIANWPPGYSLRFSSLKSVFVQKESTKEVRMAVIQCLGNAAKIRGSISDKDLSKLFLQLYNTEACSKEHVRAMLEALAGGN